MRPRTVCTSPLPNASYTLRTIPRSRTRVKAPQEVSETIHALGQAFLHPRRELSVAIGDCLEDRLAHHRGLATLLVERRRLERHVAWHALEFEGSHDALGGRDVVVDASEDVLVTVWSTVHESPDPAPRRVRLGDGHRQVFR